MNLMEPKRFARGAVLAFAGAALFAAPQSASAYSHFQPCNGKGEWDQCYDTSGQLFNPWIRIRATISGASVPTTCAKARTAPPNYNTRTPTFCGGGNYQNGTLSGPLPESQVYGYWGGTSGTRNMSVGADT